MHKGILIAIEGIDGSGKDSQAQRLEEWISARGLNVFRFSFPTYTTPLGKVIQQALTESSFDLHALQLLFSAERMSHKPAILHALTKASAVITARYSASSTIYPVGRELRDIERIMREHLETLRHEWDAFCSDDTHPA